MGDSGAGSSSRDEAVALQVRGRPLVGAKQLPRLVVCCGLPASGKSWLARALAEHRGYTRVCQDELRSRSACEASVGEAVRRGQPVVVDRCNPTAADRDAWLALAHYPSSAACVFFCAPAAECRDRAEARQGHPTLSSAGRIASAVAHFSQQLQEPSLPQERFATLALVPSFAAAQHLLSSHFGLPEEHLLRMADAEQDGGSGESLPRFVKFPRTQHLLSLGAATRDDLLMDPRERQPFLRPTTPHTLTVEEKVDGANLGISFGADFQLRAQNRSHFVNPKSHVQFKALGWWLQEHGPCLSRILLRDGETPPGRLILFGEWLAAKHSIHYTRLPDKFMAFDLYDTKEGRFYSRTRFLEALEETSIAPVRPLQGLPLPMTEADVTRLMTTPSSYYDGPLEGIYLRLDSGDWLQQRAKVVRHDFIAGDEFWDKGQITWNQVSI